MNNPNKKTIFLNLFWCIYFESLFISFRAFLPSFRVLKTSQEREMIIRMVSIIREKKVVLTFTAILLTSYKG